MGTGEEKPETYRRKYGFKLWLDGFDGSCAYAYQTGSWRDPSGWDDWGSDKWRPHILAYPTLSRPIPTLQLEGWREAIDDLRYLTLFLSLSKVEKYPSSGKNRRMLLQTLLSSKIPDDPRELRRLIIERISQAVTPSPLDTNHSHPQI